MPGPGLENYRENPAAETIARMTVEAEHQENMDEKAKDDEATSEEEKED